MFACAAVDGSTKRYRATRCGLVAAGARTEHDADYW
jgi:hypothetical protein